MDSFVNMVLKFLVQEGQPLPPIPGPGKWDKSEQPHPNTTRLSRFRPGITASATEATPLANVVYQARCEINQVHVSSPGKMMISPSGSILTLVSAGGWKNRDPIVQYLRLGPASEVSDLKQFDPGLADIAHDLAMDEERKLLFVADSQRVKSFNWGARNKLIHTLNSGKAEGPIALLSGGRIFRAGKGEARFWNIDKLEQHAKGKTIGGTFEPDTWRDNMNDDIETSRGSKAHGTVKFADSTFKPGVWHFHQPTGWMLSSENVRDAAYRCAAIDLEHGGQIVSRYLGHGGEVDFATSPGDANTFATGGSDGFARIYDVRRPLPVLTFDSGRLGEPCQDVVYIHLDGIPTLFTAGDKSEQIKMWDIRARAAVYELGTGNNSVQSMAWDTASSTLYAATECRYVDRMGGNHDYRRAKIPRWACYRPSPPETPTEGPTDDDGDEDWEDDERDEDEDDDDDITDDEGAWPKKAYHKEDFFGFAMDAAEHRLYRYAFKADADPRELPPYGQVYLGRGMW